MTKAEKAVKVNGAPGGAVEAAREAAGPLAATTLAERLAALTRLKRVVLDRSEAIVDRIQAETGKCRTDALVSEIFPVLDHIEYLEHHAHKVLGDRKVPTPLALLGKQSRVWFEPMGVVLVISPWNYPFFLGLVPTTSAFLVGNAVVYKPSEHTPLEGLLESLLKEAAFPEGAIRVVYGAGDVGRKLIDARPDKIFFTGSVATGRKILEAAAPHLIPVDLELGGKDPMIVFADANIERAAAGALWGGLTNTGQACTSVERVYVEETIYDRFRDRLVAEAKKLKQGTDKDGAADVGLMTADFQVKKVADQLKEAKAKGAKLLTGTEWDGKSRSIPPVVVESPPGTQLLTEETFGPVIPLVKFRGEDEAVRLANDSEYGLSASVWSKDLARAERVARRLAVGNVSINNVMLTEGNAALPFGGAKNSGFGRSKGEFGLYAFARIKSVLFDKDSAKHETNWYPYTPEKYRLFADLIRYLFGGNKVKFILTGLKLEGLAARLAKEGRK